MPEPFCLTAVAIQPALALSSRFVACCSYLVQDRKRFTKYASRVTVSCVPRAAHRVRSSSFVKRLRSEASSGAQEHRSSLATEAISSQLSAISAFNRISSLTEILKRFTCHERNAPPGASD